MRIRHAAKGFTLIELMIVVAIIGILAAIAIPAYSDYTIRAQVTEGLVLINELKPSINEYYKDRGRFPRDNELAGVPAPEHLLGQYVSGVTVADGAMHIRFGNKVNARVKDQILSVRPLYVTASPASPISWNCGYSALPDGMSAAGEDRTNVPSKFLPSSCRR
jgi:type IV pilus assembly protein PilA